MGRDRQKRQATKGDAAGIGKRTARSECPVIVVAIGVSAGGLKSLKKIFANMPPGHGVAFVIIPHPESSGENLTVKQLREQTGLAVVEATDGMPVLADRIHVTPTDKFLNIAGSRLTLDEPRQCNGLWMPVDHFFCSLAVDQRRRACGILLSGIGGDGTLGLSEVKAAGGRTLVEDPDGVEFPPISRSAIDAGVADSVLPAEAMAETILALAEQVIADTRNEAAESPEFDGHLRTVLDILRAKVGHDFRSYKPNTLVRRIRRRMTMGKIATFADYARFLNENPDEVGLLQKDLLIGVTEFFRQPQAWEILEEKVIAPLVENARPGSEIRVWVPGCSTGQEAYSTAMMLAEQVEKSGKKVGYQLFATDSDVAALAAARNGSYSKEEIGENISPGRLTRFFARKDGYYQVAKTLRDRVVFAPQNVTADPPFSRLDLISCRNLMIYLDQQVQRKIIALFHFALREGAFLFLGNAETIGDREDLFEPVSKKWRIYRRIGVGRPLGVEIPVRPTGEPLPAPVKMPVSASPSRMSLASMAQQMLLDRFAPACVMIDRKLQVVYVHGAVEEYLTFPPGELTIRVVDMAREGLRARLRGAIGKCVEMGKPVSVTARVRRGQKSLPVKATVSPLRAPREADGLLLITFEDYPVPAAKSRRPAAGESNVHQLQDELKVTREELQSTIEQLEGSNDQLKASNEEVTAANEELQSANEEMETSKEELQSLNEELNTINSRLHEKVEELESSNNDIVNLLSSTSIATVFLDKELKVRRYTPASTRLLSLIPSDAGRPIADVLRRFTDEALLDDTRRVLADLTPLSKEVPAEDGAWYIRRITPYRTQDDRIEGVVVTFVDICDLKATEEALRRHQAELETARAEAEDARHRLAVIVDSIADGFFAFDREWRITHVNDAALRHYGKTREEMVGRGLFEVFPAARGSVFETEYRRAMESGEPVHFEAPSAISDRIMEIHAYPGPDNLTVLFRDVTERNRLAAALQEARERAEWLARFPEENPNPLMRVSADGTVLYRNPAASKLPEWAYEAGQLLPNPLLALIGRAMGEESETEQSLELGGKFYSVWVAPFPGESYANVYARDITARKKAEETLRRYELLSAHTRDIILFMRRDDGRILEANSAAVNAYGYSRDELLTLGIPNLRTPDTRGLTAEQMAEADSRGILFETVHRRKDGSTFPVEVSSRGATVGGTRTLISVVRDITERKRAEEDLRKNEATLRGILDATKESIWLFSRDGVMLMANETALSRFGKTAEELIGKHFEEILPEELAHSRLLRLREAVESGRPVEFEDQRSGIFFQHGFYPVSDVHGRVNSVACFSRDITARKQSEGALKEATLLIQQNSSELDAILETMTDPLLFYDAQGWPRKINTAAARILGIDRDVSGLDDPAIMAIWNSKNYRDLDGRPLSLEEMPFRRALNGETVHGQVLCLTTAAGREAIFEINAEILDSNGQRVGVVVVWHDITERKHREFRIARLTKLYAVLSQVNEAIVRTHDEERLYGEVCRIVAEEGGFPLVWVGRVEEPRVVPTASYGPAVAYLKEIRVETEGALGSGPTGTCIREDRPVINDDFDINPSAAPWRKPALRFGFRASAAFPLHRHGRVVGVLTLYAAEPGAFDQEQVNLLEALCADISYALEAMRQERLRTEAEESLRRRTLELQKLTETLEQRVEERTAELVKSNEMLQEEMAERLRLVAAVEQAGEGIAITDPMGIIVYVNPAFGGISGDGERELLGKYYCEILAGYVLEAGLKKRIQDIIHSGGVWSGRVNRKKRDGQSFALDVTLSPIRDGSGAVSNYLAMERDVTQEVRLEQNLRRMQKAEALGTLAGGIAHDFNNILNPIFINTELVLLDAPPDSPMRQPLHLVLEAAERGKGLVKQIITFSRMKEHEAKPLKAEPLIKEALKFLRASLPSTVEIREKIERETGFILADPTQIHQVVMNLCSNAAYAMRERGGLLEVSLAEVEADEDMARLHPDLNPGTYLRLTVSDTGVGMTREVMERAFDPFFTTKKPGEGSGMGLSVVHGIVRNAKGAVTVYSEAGKGATFNVFFPRVEAEGSSFKVPSGPIATGRERILLVDDEEVQVQSIRNMLERLGYKVVAKTDSVEALSLFRKDPGAFDLVVTDQTMPQLTGVRLAEELLRIRPGLPVILCTGFSEAIDANEAQAAGIRQFLMKPFSVRDMSEAIRRALGDK